MEETDHDVSIRSQTNQLTPEQLCAEDIATQLINIESITGTIEAELEKIANGDGMTALPLKSLLPKLADLQNCLLKSSSAHARPLVRRTLIFKLPDEVLIKVFEKLKEDLDSRRDEYRTSGINNIKNLRLVCRRFCDASSHLLLCRLDVSLTISSLEHLDKVSSHPTISKGIRVIRITLHDPIPAISLRDFISQMREQNDQLLGFIQSSTDLFNRFSPSPGVLANLSAELDKLDRSGFLLSHTEHLQVFPPDMDSNMVTLCRFYEHYRQVIEEQNVLLGGDTFVTRVAEAVARMPTVIGLSITELDTFELPPLPTEISHPNYAIFKELLRTWRWAPEGVSLLEKKALKLLYKLPLAFGNQLREFRLFLSPETEHNLRPRQEDTGDLVRAAEHLTVLEVHCHMSLQAFHTEKRSLERVSLSEFASLFFNSANLRSVTICCNSKAGLGESSDAGPILSLLPWAKLTEISLGSISIHYHELLTHINKLSPGTHIILDEVYLLSGIWVDLLDVLRGRADCNSSVTYLAGKVDGETDAFWETVDAEWDFAENPASAYVRGQIADNPLQLSSVPDSTDSEHTFEGSIDI